ncbi:hypothetical protein COT99_03735 [Candidatus Falkowbacteria bacterium CG10_big_fil_rev_8_21_14_0_10_43_10]|uniref:Uncharacterized protein n=1 Tax=Candidatus Falkowbacteria bacterium CG10_big_fil_rev_8_21_14_0_10_43_10 TaxID=1974567 RepID=A0A2H0V1H7_9BACT|nr:MAG: hypothetical protein COT99_03735 [Candidatus Falkowbacteria bacterium CG10_big_fil_rev_8_21_14_0_10_43_10]
MRWFVVGKVKDGKKIPDNLNFLNEALAYLREQISLGKILSSFFCPANQETWTILDCEGKELKPLIFEYPLSQFMHFQATDEYIPPDADIWPKLEGLMTSEIALEIMAAKVRGPLATAI